MKRIYPIIAAALVVLCSSCSEEKLTMKALEKLQGEWEYNDVMLQQEGWFKSKDKTSEFRDIRWVFKEDGEALRIQPSSNDTVFGTYELISVDPAEYEINFKMILETSDPYEIQNISWRYVCIHKKQIDATEDTPDGETYTYNLRKRD